MDRNLSSGSGVPLGHKFFAFLLAVAVAAGVFAWQRRHATQSASAALLSFDPAAAQKLDPGLAQSSEPASALAQSILTDPVVANLAQPAYLASSQMPARIGEFRSRLALSQPSQKTLRVQFTDPDPAKSMATANAVAKVLADWSPLTPAPASVAAPAPTTAPAAAPTPAPSAQTQPPAPAPPPPPKPAANDQDRAGPSLAASLGELEKPLSSASRELDEHSTSGHSRHYRELASYSQSRQQQLLNTQVRAAEKKLADLRTRFSGSSALPGAKTRLDQIQQALSSIWPASASRQSLRAHGFNAAGTSASQLREERDQLTQAIAVIEKQRTALEAQEAAEPSAAQSEPIPGASTPAPSASATPPPSSISESNVPASAPAASQLPAPASDATPQSSEHPLALLHLAKPAPPTPLAPSLIAGLICGFLYWAATAGRYRSASTEDESSYEEAAAPASFRFITPNEPVAPPQPSKDKESVAAASWHRAAFVYDPTPVDPPPSMSEFLGVPSVEDPPVIDPLPKEHQVPEPDEYARLIDAVHRAEHPEHHLDPAISHAQETSAASPPVLDENEPQEDQPLGPNQTAPIEAAYAIEETHAVEETHAIENGHVAEAAHVVENVQVAEAPFVAEAQPPAPQPENVVEMADPWASYIMQSLAQTKIARMLDGDPAPAQEPANHHPHQETSRPAAADEETPRRFTASNRLAG